MPEIPGPTLNQVVAKVQQHDTELSSQLTQLVALERKVADLTTIAEALFALCSSIQRTSHTQEDAFKSLEERLKKIAEE
jgi:chaperonin cofactor prefoldin